MGEREREGGREGRKEGEEEGGRKGGRKRGERRREGGREGGREGRCESRCSHTQELESPPSSSIKCITNTLGREAVVRPSIGGTLTSQGRQAAQNVINTTIIPLAC